MWLKSKLISIFSLLLFNQSKISICLILERPFRARRKTNAQYHTEQAEDHGTQAVGETLTKYVNQCIYIRNI